MSASNTKQVNGLKRDHLAVVDVAVLIVEVAMLLVELALLKPPFLALYSDVVVAKVWNKMINATRITSPIIYFTDLFI